jgi:hypothetical protein
MREIYKKEQLLARLKKIAEKNRLREIGATSAVAGIAAQTPPVVAKPSPSPAAARKTTSARNEPPSASTSAGTSQSAAGPAVFDLSAIDDYPPAHVVIDRWAIPDQSHNCPEGYRVKANANSRIYHLPDDPDYDRTIPEVCFANEDEASLAGFRRRLPPPPPP